MAESPGFEQLGYHQLARVCPLPLRLGPAVCARRWADDPCTHHEPELPVVGSDVHLDHSWSDRCQHADPVWEVRVPSTDGCRVD